jgi:ribosomal protein S27AE
MKLSHIGFHFSLDGKVVKVRFEGEDLQDPETVSSLWAIVKANKDEVRYFLKSFCPRCGGVGTCPDYEGRPLCLVCDWEKLQELIPALRSKP